MLAAGSQADDHKSKGFGDKIILRNVFIPVSYEPSPVV